MASQHCRCQRRTPLVSPLTGKAGTPAGTLVNQKTAAVQPFTLCDIAPRPWPPPAPFGTLRLLLPAALPSRQPRKEHATRGPASPSAPCCAHAPMPSSRPVNQHSCNRCLRRHCKQHPAYMCTPSNAPNLQPLLLRDAGNPKLQRRGHQPRRRPNKRRPVLLRFAPSHLPHGLCPDTTEPHAAAAAGPACRAQPRRQHWHSCGAPCCSPQMHTQLPHPQSLPATPPSTGARDTAALSWVACTDATAMVCRV